MFCLSCLVFFIPLRQTEAVTWENFVPAVQKRDPVLPGLNFSHVITVYNLYNICNLYNLYRI